MNKTNPKPPSIRVRLCPEQKVALSKIADDRDVPVEALMRDVIAGMTGVPDTLRRHGRRGAGLPGRRRPRQRLRKKT